MTWTYAPDVMAPGDAVRFLVGDTVSTDPQFENEELAWLLNENGSNVYGAAAAACGQLASRYSRLADKTVGDLHISLSQRAGAYAARRAEYEERGGATVPLVVPYVGGLTDSDKQIDQDDTDLVQHYFGIGSQENPSRGATSSDFPLTR